MGGIIEMKNVTVSYYGHTALENISCHISGGQLTGIIGPNGAGKSTFIKALLGMVPLKKGKISLFDTKMSRVRKRIAYVPQRSQIDLDFPVLVRDVVMMGRYPHISWWGWPSYQDSVVVNQCLSQVGMLDYSKRQIGELSGGQQQRVFIARALAQEADLFLLDEPFAGIDVSSEEIIINLLKAERLKGKTIVTIHHDLSKVASYFDTLLMLNKSCIAYGPVKEVFTPANLKKAYSGNVTLLQEKDGMLVVSG
jgi:ABC-type Mn2+/Zn2+ transport system ATPase subunit